jgi:GT2 family glycosyltransferase
VTVDTVLVAYNSEDVVGRALALAGELGGRVVVVDHGDGASAWLAATRGAVAIHDPTNPGFGAGQNRGVAFTDSEFVLLCNPDAEIVPAAVLAGVELLRSRPDLAAVQGVIVNAATRQPERSAGVEVGPVHLLGRALGAKALLGLPAVAALARRSSLLRDHAERVPPGPVEVDSLAATAVLVRRSALDAVGGFDESYFLYGEDLDLCRRLRAAGWRLLALPEVWATHASGGSAHSGWHRESNWWRGTLQFGAGRWSRPAWTVAVLAAAIRWMRLAVRHPIHAPATFRALVRDSLRQRRAASGLRPAARGIGHRSVPQH